MCVSRKVSVLRSSTMAIDAIFIHVDKINLFIMNTRTEIGFRGSDYFHWND